MGLLMVLRRLKDKKLITSYGFGFRILLIGCSGFSLVFGYFAASNLNKSLSLFVCIFVSIRREMFQKNTIDPVSRR